MRHLWPVWFYNIFSTYHFQGEKKSLNIKVCFLYTTCVSFQEEFSEILSYTYTGLHVKCPLFFSHFHKTLIFFEFFSENTRIPNFMKICSVGVELFHADRLTDWLTDRHDEAKITFRNSANTPQNSFSNTHRFCAPNIQDILWYLQILLQALHMLFPFVRIQAVFIWDTDILFDMFQAIFISRKLLTCLGYLSNNLL